MPCLSTSPALKCCFSHRQGSRSFFVAQPEDVRMLGKSKIHQLHTGRSPVVVKSRCRPPKTLTSSIIRSRLDQALAKAQETRTTLLIAPAGTGKTELLSQWSQTLHQQGEASAWLTLCNTDNPLAMTLASVLESFRRAITPE